MSTDSRFSAIEINGETYVPQIGSRNGRQVSTGRWYRFVRPTVIANSIRVAFGRAPLPALPVLLDSHEVPPALRAENRRSV